MLALLVALVSALLGAVLSRSAQVRLAQRTERRMARAGANALQHELESARDLIRMSLPAGRWWDEPATPSLPAWEQFQQVLIAELDPDTVEKLQDAVQKLQDVKVMGALRQQAFGRAEIAYQKRRDAEIDSRAQRGISDPWQAVRDDTAFQVKLNDMAPSRNFDPNDAERVERTSLEKADKAIDVAINALKDRKIQESLREPGPPRWQPKITWAWVGGVVTVVAAVLALSWVLAPRTSLPASAVERALADRLQTPFVVCTNSATQEVSAWKCRATFRPGPRSTCPDLSASTSLRAGTSLATLLSQDTDQKRPPGCAGLEDYECRELQSGLRLIAEKIAVSDQRREVGDPPVGDGSNLDSGSVPVEVNDPSDTLDLRVPEQPRKPFWKFW